MRGRTFLPARRLWAGPGKKVGVVTVSVALVLAGCSSASGSTPPAAPSTSVAGLGRVTTTPDGVQEVTLQTQDDYVFTPDHFTVAPGKVRLTVVNVATQLTHNFRFTPDDGPAPIQAEIPLLAPGDRRTIEFTVQQPGDYGYECSFHTQLKQFGVMTVRG
jgi:plastocyanin